LRFKGVRTIELREILLINRHIFHREKSFPDQLRHKLFSTSLCKFRVLFKSKLGPVRALVTAFNRLYIFWQIKTLLAEVKQS
jgi:hypothetical protein